MAGKKGKKTKVKAKAISLSEFLGAGAGIGPDATVVSAPKVKYDEEDREEFYGNEQILLPTCPRTSRGPHVDTEQIPTTGPFTAHVANLPFEVDEYDIRKFFADLPIVNVRLPMDRDGIRMKGYGYVEFETRTGLIDAISLHEEMMKGRKIRVDLPENEGREGDRGGRDGYRREGGGSRYGDRDGGRGEDREERSLAVSDWRNAPPAERDESRAGGGGGGGFGDRDRGGGGGGGFGDRDRGGFGDRDRGGAFGDRDRDRGSSGGFGDRDRGGGGGGFADRDRGGGRFGGGGRFDDDRRGGGGGDRGPSRSDDEPWRRGGAGGGSGGGGGGFSDRKPGGGFDDRYGDRDRGTGGGGGFDRMEERRPRAGGLDRPDEPAKERPRLQLKPRSVPAAADGGPAEASSGPVSDAHDEAEALPEAPPAAAALLSGGAGSSIFGSARPVDTAARERELLDRAAKKSPLVPKRESPKASSADIFGAAKPVDTAARELAIEQKIASGKSPVIPKKAPMPASKTDIFGAARPVDTTSREREIEEKLRTRVPAAADSAPPVRDTWRDRGAPKESSGYGGSRDVGGGGYGGRAGDSGRGGRDLGASRGGGGDYDRRDRFRDGGRGGGDYPRGGDTDRDGYRNGRLEGRGNYGSREGSRDGYTSARIGDSERRNGVEKSQPEEVAAPPQVERPDDYDSDEERFKKAQPKGKDVPSTLNVKNKFANLDLEEDLP